MDTPTTSPIMLIVAAAMIGVGIYVIQRGRFVLPHIFSKVPFLRTHRGFSRNLFWVLLTLGVVVAGLGCRILYQYFT